MLLHRLPIRYLTSTIGNGNAWLIIFAKKLNAIVNTSSKRLEMLKIVTISSQYTRVYMQFKKSLISLMTITIYKQENKRQRYLKAKTRMHISDSDTGAHICNWGLNLH